MFYISEYSNTVLKMYYYNLTRVSYPTVIQFNKCCGKINNFPQNCIDKRCLQNQIMIWSKSNDVINVNLSNIISDSHPNL